MRPGLVIPTPTETTSHPIVRPDWGGKSIMRQKCVNAKLCWKISHTKPFRFSNGLRFCDLPQPKFRIGQYVSTGYWCDDHLDPERFGRFIKYYGYITGIVYDHSQIGKPCWTYQIHLVLFDGVPASEVNWATRDFLVEDELKRATWKAPATACNGQRFTVAFRCCVSLLRRNAVSTSGLLLPTSKRLEVLRSRTSSLSVSAYIFP